MNPEKITRTLHELVVVAELTIIPVGNDNNDDDE